MIAVQYTKSSYLSKTDPKTSSASLEDYVTNTSCVLIACKN